MQLLSRPQELSLHLSGRLALHLEDGDEIHKQAPDSLKNLNYFSPHHSHTHKRRYSLNELKTILSNTKARLNSDDSLSSNEYDKLNTREIVNGEQETSTTDKIQDKNMSVSTNSVPGLDPPTSSTASKRFPANNTLNTKDINHEQEMSTTGKMLHFSNVAVSSHDVQGIDPPTHNVASIEQLSIIEDDKMYPTPAQNSQGQPAESGQSSQTKLSSSDLKVGLLKRKSSNKLFELPRDYPLFESPYPPPLVDGHLCR